DHHRDPFPCRRVGRRHPVPRLHRRAGQAPRGQARIVAGAHPRQAGAGVPLPDRRLRRRSDLRPPGHRPHRAARPAHHPADPGGPVGVVERVRVGRPVLRRLQEEGQGHLGARQATPGELRRRHPGRARRRRRRLLGRRALPARGPGEDRHRYL
ncbi:MAG: hypothetical protein AVDCRST_MAG57-2349, partial [uncultured Blastococcus sp.]